MKNVIKLEFVRGTCAICNTDNNKLKSIERNYLFNHSVENYSDMLMKCFGIKLVNSEDKTVDVEICGSCVSSLRSATTFRQLVEAAEKRARKNIPHMKNGKPVRKSSKYPKNLSYSQTNQKSHSTKPNKNVLRLEETLTDSIDWSRQGALHQFQVKLEKTDEEFNDNLSNLSNQPLSKLLEDSNSVDNTFDAKEQVTKNLSFLQTKQKSHGIKQNKKVLQLTEILTDNTDWSRPGALHQFQVKLETNNDKFNDNLTNLSNQPLSKLLEDSNSVDNIFDPGEQVTDGESSTTSAQMRVATGYEREIERSKRKKEFVKPSLDISCTTCPICDRNFETRRLLSKHYDNHFPKFICDICGLSYYKKGSYYEHKKLHFLTDRHACTLCPRSFLSYNSVRAHVRTHHNKVKPMGCYECDARFSNSVCRRRHMSLKHGIECTMYPCPICKKSFYSSWKLNTHVNKTHDNIKNCVCTVCDKGFYGKQELREHMVKHTDAKKHSCDQCGKGFPRLRSLTEHLKIHNNIKNYVCEVCHKAFVQKCSLTSHLKMHSKISN